MYTALNGATAKCLVVIEEMVVRKDLVGVGIVSL